MASYSGTFGGTGGTPRFRLEGFPEEEEEGIPIARSFDQLLLTQTEDRPRITIRREPEYGVAAGDSSSAVMQRRPYLFSPPRNTSQSSIFSNPSAVGGNDQQNNQANAAAMVGQLQQEENMAIRYRLFNRLDPGGANLLMPTHDDDGKQSSLVTVFSIWNTMVGTSLLAVPWALQQAGLIFGIILMLVMAAIAFYTAYRIVESPNSLALETTTPDFSDVCRFFWGKYGEYFSVFFSVMVLIGGVVLYFVLMSNFLYFTGNVIYESLQPNSTILPIMVNNSLICDVYCPEPFKSAYPDDLLSLVNPWFSSASDLLYAEKGSYFRDIWKLQGGVPLILALCLFPLLNFKSPGFFMRFNVLGTVSVVYLLCFTLTKSFECGLNIDFLHPNSEHFVHLFNWKFPALTGTLALSYFIHNAILTILRNQKHPENNARDLLIGYILSAGCYIVISVVFFLAFPTFRNCISDNFLNNFGGGDVLSAIARIFLLFQMLTVLPLLMYLIRVQFSYVFAGTVYPGLFYVLLINIGILTIALFFGVVYPHVGPIIRYVGSICGLVYMFLLPCGVHLKRLQMQGRLTPFQIGIHAFIMFCGVINLFAQFLV